MLGRPGLGDRMCYRGLETGHNAPLLHICMITNGNLCYCQQGCALSFVISPFAIKSLAWKICAIKFSMCPRQWMRHGKGEEELTTSDPVGRKRGAGEGLVALSRKRLCVREKRVTNYSVPCSLCRKLPAGNSFPSQVHPSAHSQKNRSMKLRTAWRLHFPVWGFA